MIVSVVSFENSAEPLQSTNLTIKPTSEQYDLQIKRGKEFIQLGQLDNALIAFDLAVNTMPNEKTAYDFRGCLFLGRGEYEKAVSNFSEVLKQDPSDLRTRLNRANAFRGNHNFSKAIDDFDIYLNVIQTNPVAYNSRASALIHIKQFKKAILDCNSSLKLSQIDPRVYVIRGVAHSQLGEYENALRDFTKTLQLDESNAEAHNQIAWLKATCPDEAFRHGKIAVASAIKACELTAWKNAQNLDTLAAAYGEVKDFSKAVEYQKQALKLNQSDEFATPMQKRLDGYKKSNPFRDMTN